MADMHVLTGDGNRYRVVMHFDVPAGNNSAGVAWSDAVPKSAGLGELGNPATPKTILRDGDGTGATIDATEKTAVESGAMFEHVADFLIESSGFTPLEVRAALRYFYAREKAGVQAAMQRELKWFGTAESEA